MNGPQHYREAERLIELCTQVDTIEWVAENLAAAQVHATLALAAATVEQTSHSTRWHDAAVSS